MRAAAVNSFVYIYIYTFQAAVVPIQLYGFTARTLTKRMAEKLDGNYTRILWAILIKSWKQHPIKQQLYGHLPPNTKTIQVRRTRHAGHSWRSRDEFIIDVLLWTPSHGLAKARRPARTYIQQLSSTGPESTNKKLSGKYHKNGSVLNMKIVRTKKLNQLNISYPMTQF